MRVTLPVNPSGKKTSFLQRFPIRPDNVYGLYFAIGLSFLIKVAIALFTKVINDDGALYITVAQEFKAGRFREAYALFPMPLYPIAISLFHFLIPDWVLAARFVSIVSSSLTLIPLYLLSSRLCGQQAAFWACTAFAISPVPCSLAVEIIRDPLFLFFLAWTVYFALRAMESKRLLFFLATMLAWGLSLGFRYEALVFLAFFLLFLVGVWFRNQSERRPLFKGILLLCSLPLIVWTLLTITLGRNWHSFNRIGDAAVFFLHEVIGLRFMKSYHLIMEQLKVLKDSPPLPGGGFFAETAIHYLPIIYLLGFLQKLIEALCALFIIPLVLGLRQTLNRERMFTLLLAALHLGIGYYFVITRDALSKRYLYAAVYLLYPWVGKGMEQIVSVFKETRRFRLLALAFLVLFCVLPPFQYVKSLWGQDTIVKTAAEWLASQADLQGQHWASNERKIPFYAGRGKNYFYYPTTDYPSMEQHALADQADLLIIRISSKKRHLLPAFQNFTVVREFEGKKNLVVLYQFNDPKRASVAAPGTGSHSHQ